MPRSVLQGVVCAFWHYGMALMATRSPLAIITHEDAKSALCEQAEEAINRALTLLHGWEPNPAREPHRA